MPRANYIYTIQTKDYVKFGITDRPRQRLKEHCIEIDQDLTFHSLWKVTGACYEELERRVTAAMAGYPKHSKERIDAPMDVVVDAVETEASKLGATLTARSRKISVRRPARYRSNPLSDEETERLKAVFDQPWRGVPDLLRKALLAYMEMKENASNDPKIPARQV